MNILVWCLKKLMDITGITWFISLFKSLYKIIIWSINAFTGRGDFQKAKRMYEELQTHYSKKKDEYKRKTNELFDKINLHIQSINESKIDIKLNLFPRFAKKIQRIKKVVISDIFIKESFLYSTFTADGIKNREDLFLIDFDNNPIKLNLQALLSLGFKTRSKAEESLYKVGEEEKRLKEESGKMDAEIARLCCIQKATEQTADYFNSLIDLYSVLMNRLDNSIHFLLISQALNGNFSHYSKMTIDKLPLVQQKEIKVMFSISLIMKKMVETKITVDASSESILNVMREYYEQVNKLYNAV